MRRAPGALFSFLLLGGCNQILGNGEPSVQEPTGGPGGNTSTTSQGTGGTGAGGDTGGNGGGTSGTTTTTTEPLCYDPEWAQWKPTGAPALGTPMNGWLIDQNTGLAWHDGTEDPAVWDADPPCGAVAAPPFDTPARRPTLAELLSLVGYDADGIQLPGLKDAILVSKVWSATNTLDPAKAWSVDMTTGRPIKTDKATPLHGFCVASPREVSSVPVEPSCRYENVDDRVLDRRTGLTWGPLSPGPSYLPSTYTLADGACKQKRARLPAIYEIATLIDVRRQDPAWHGNVFGDAMLSAHFWTSTPSMMSSVFTIDMNTGETGSAALNDPLILHLCVKD